MVNVQWKGPKPFSNPGTKVDGGGLKYDKQKAPMDLIPAEAEIEEALVWGYGAKKYAEHNFRKGLKYSKIIAAAKRHLNAIQRGEDRDFDPNCPGCNQLGDCKEHSGRKHWACVRCCMGMLAVMEIEHPELDDRYKVKLTQKGCPDKIPGDAPKARDDFQTDPRSSISQDSYSHDVLPSAAGRDKWDPGSASVCPGEVRSPGAEV